MCSRDCCFVMASGANFRETGKHLTHSEWEEQQNEIHDKFNKRNSDGGLHNPTCSCGKNNSWDAFYCSRCGEKLIK